MPAAQAHRVYDRGDKPLDHARLTHRVLPHAVARRKDTHQQRCGQQHEHDQTEHRILPLFFPEQVNHQQERQHGRDQRDRIIAAANDWRQQKRRHEAQKPPAQRIMAHHLQHQAIHPQADRVKERIGERARMPI